ncbi:HIT family protein [Nocardioides sp. Root140]|uniref:HIT family protein n=1 Tax=Nocardioides sp. Root140 TaxID=1736460 RepID=UPI0009EAD53F|nr:HIT domain-containing protein [Nocardioides sp. Root140]
MTSSGPCPFCQIVKGEDPNARVVYQDQNVTAFFPLTPATRGHTLVVPNRHVAEHVDLTDAESRQLGAAVRRTAIAVRSAVSPDGLNLIQSTGVTATQTIPHVHFHVVPRWAGDALTLSWPADAAESSNAQEQTLALVRSTLPSRAGDVSPEDRRQHLTFVQAIVTRMSQASSAAKTWLLPIVTLTYGYAVTKQQFWVAVLGLIAVAIFGLLDANYLKQERAFRKLYDSVSAGGDIPAFALNPALAGPGGTKVNYWPDWEDIRSWAVAPVYGPLLLAGIAIAVWAHCH